MNYNEFKQEAIDRFSTHADEVDITSVLIGEESGKPVFKITAYLDGKACYGRADTAGKAIDRCIISKSIYTDEKKRVCL